MNNIIETMSNRKYEFIPIPPVDILIIEIPYNYNEEEINKIKKDVSNPYLIFIYNPNITELKTHYIKTK
jgi:ABC-type sulfate transport system substrate-binding protein